MRANIVHGEAVVFQEFCDKLDRRREGFRRKAPSASMTHNSIPMAQLLGELLAGFSANRPILALGFTLFGRHR
jgi:hypothetical protein